MSYNAPILITGFTPFGGETINPSWQVAQRFADREMLGARIHAIELPTVFGDAEAILQRAIRKRRPGLVLMLGEAGNRSRISIERVAINLADARIPDNAGKQPKDQPLLKNGPAAYFSTLPVSQLHESLLAAEIPAECSLSAGSFVCNAVMYRALHVLADLDASARAGFIHLPYLPEQAVKHRFAPSMALSDQVAAIEIVLRTLLDQ
ncbi:pyroglutamyl-peptidase I [Ahniella affigens]|uniref:Pyrrolidone-carboxylate peptidase n=1 Tax=Ahniella affigens TaxID=2021234 RepID=A0A2P1PVF6_9GAMM|nr:pyroglutamyl-peptidase I [Ahniella affigens]AVP98833.1 pyroglutamyl-peptidase I [Ahniella affigens]